MRPPLCVIVYQPDSDTGITTKIYTVYGPCASDEETDAFVSAHQEQYPPGAFSYLVMPLARPVIERRESLPA